ncbi:MAG TPA: DUF1707 domain-containing protein [Solirubrobacteraceae bacterium]
MPSDPNQLVSDDEREQAVSLLRAGLVDGRLTLDEFSQRVEFAYGARVGSELAWARSGLPDRGRGPLARPRRRPTRLTAALFGHVVRRGRLRLRRRTVALSAFSDLDLDLREAELDTAVTSVAVLVLFGNADLYVPEGVEVSVAGVGLFGHRREWGRDIARPDVLLLRVHALSLFGTVDVWRVPADAPGDYGEIMDRVKELSC